MGLVWSPGLISLVAGTGWVWGPGLFSEVNSRAGYSGTVPGTWPRPWDQGRFGIAPWSVRQALFGLGPVWEVSFPQHTPQCQVALGSCDGRPGSAEGQQQSSLGGLRKCRIKASGRRGGIRADGCVPEDDRWPDAAPSFHTAARIRLSLHGCVCPPPAWAMASGLLRPQADIHAVRRQ